jgi:hypothetical protein
MEKKRKEKLTYRESYETTRIEEAATVGSPVCNLGHTLLWAVRS